MPRLYTLEDGPRTLHKFNSADALVAYCVLTLRGPASISVNPGSGNVAVSFSLDTVADVVNGVADWEPAQGLGPAGVVSSRLIDHIPGSVTAVRFVATTADATAKVSQ